MSGLGGLNKATDGVVIGLMQLQNPWVVTKDDLAKQTDRICAMVGKARRNMPTMDLVVFPEYALHGLSMDINPDIMCRLDYLKERFDDPDVKVLNVLWETHFRGEANPFGTKRVGHIPGSVNIPIEEFLTQDDRGVFKSARELGAILDKADISRDHELIVHCYAGVRTTLGFFVLRLLGWDRVRAYDAAMAEWANRDDTPLTLDSS